MTDAGDRPAHTWPAVSAVAAVAVGGAVGACLRLVLGELVPDGDGFPATTLAINVAGSFLLGALPALTLGQHRPWVTHLLGPGLLGGFTTLSLYADQGRALLAEGRSPLALAYLAGTLVSCVAAVLLADRLARSAPGRRGRAEASR